MITTVGGAASDSITWSRRREIGSWAYVVMLESAVVLILQVNKIITRTFLQLAQIYEFVKGGTYSQNKNEGKEIWKFGWDTSTL